MSTHRVCIEPLPPWVDAPRLLGEEAFELQPSATHPGCLRALAELPVAAAADVAARMRALSLGGMALRVVIEPALPRARVRAARADEARRMRDRSPGFLRADARVDARSRVGLTPEAIALAMGLRARALLDGGVGRSESRALSDPCDVVDLCCGVGGNAIGFARAGLRVAAIEIDPARAQAARHNARVYGVSDRVHVACGDARALAGSLRAPLWFIDVPWLDPADVTTVVTGANAAACDLRLLDELLALRPQGVAAWAKVPAAFDVTRLPGAEVVAWFGVAAGDYRRVKFLTLELPAAAA